MLPALSVTRTIKEIINDRPGKLLFTSHVLAVDRFFFALVALG